MNQNLSLAQFERTKERRKEGVWNEEGLYQTPLLGPKVIRHSEVTNPTSQF